MFIYNLSVIFCLLICFVIVRIDKLINKYHSATLC